MNFLSGNGKYISLYRKGCGINFVRHLRRGLFGWISGEIARSYLKV